MNIEQQVKLMAEIQLLFAKMYRLELSERVKKGIRVKKERSLLVNKSKV